MSVNLNQISQNFSPQIAQEEASLQNLMEGIDVTDPTSLLKVQMEMTRYNTEIGMASSIMKDVKDAVSQVTQRL